MRKLELKPDGWVCSLRECPPGFFVFKGQVCFKSEYTGDDGRIEAFCDSGEYFWGGTDNATDVAELMVQPVTCEWVDEL